MNVFAALLFLVLSLNNNNPSSSSNISSSTFFSTSNLFLISGDISDILPTNGFSLIDFKYNNNNIIAYDLGGSEKIRAIWDTYFPEVFGVIYVIDGSDEGRLEEAGDLLRSIISNKDLKGKPILILLNKKDQENFIFLSAEVSLANEPLAVSHSSQEICSAIRGTGKFIDPAIKDGFNWLLENIFNDYEKLQCDIENALKLLKQRHDEEKLRRNHRLNQIVSRFVHFIYNSPISAFFS
ncbi:unnamed protein product [Dracunculus medinensis]|uniref:Uncharacterized protein n=1 Tax=Dracunculus medinensis TaxID=318479 RepID=A0A0N4UEJ7_DRAME|nr:unnamed protein product [Dracunculus medinensis]